MLLRFFGARILYHVGLQHHRDGRVHERCEVGTTEAFAHLDQPLDVDVLCDRLALQGYLEYVLPRIFVWKRYVDDLVEPTGSKQSGVDHVYPVGCSQHNHSLERLNSVELGEELAYDSLGYHAVAAHPSHGR